jgi:ribosomal protein L16/L10AE
MQKLDDANDKCKIRQEQLEDARNEMKRKFNSIS